MPFPRDDGIAASSRTDKACDQRLFEGWARRNDGPQMSIEPPRDPTGVAPISIDRRRAEIEEQRSGFLGIDARDAGKPFDESDGALKLRQRVVLHVSADGRDAI